MLRIGSVHVDSRVLLAPMAGYTDLAFRLVVRAAGHCGLAFTELLNSRGVLVSQASSINIARHHQDDRPFGMQLYGNDIDWLCQAAVWAERHGAELIDINMGCPVDKVTKCNGGSMLLCDPDRTTRMAEAIVKSVRVPVTAKLRLGWDRQHLTAPVLARQLEEVGIAMITVHGRTTKQRYKGSVDLDGIKSVVESVESIPVIGNGDVLCAEDAQRMIDVTGCDGVMVGRASLKKPWVLRDIQSWFDDGRIPPEPTVVEKVRLIRLHFDKVAEYRGVDRAVRLMRGRISLYGTTMGHIKPIKEKVRLMREPMEFYEAMDELESGVDPAWTSVPVGVFVSDD